MFFISMITKEMPSKILYCIQCIAWKVNLTRQYCFCVKNIQHRDLQDLLNYDESWHKFQFRIQPQILVPDPATNISSGSSHKFQFRIQPQILIPDPATNLSSGSNPFYLSIFEIIEKTPSNQSIRRMYSQLFAIFYFTLQSFSTVLHTIQNLQA